MAYDTQPTPSPSMYNKDNPYGFKLNVNHPPYQCSVETIHDIQGDRREAAYGR